MSEAEALSKDEKTKLRTILNDTIKLLVSNAMSGKFNKDYIVSSVIGITCDDDDAVIVRYHDRVKNPKHPDSEQEAAEEAEAAKKRKAKKRKGGAGAGPDTKYQRQDQDYGGGYDGYGYDVKHEQGQHGYADASYQDTSMMGGGDPNMTQMAAPAQPMGDLNEQVELMPGTGVFIKRATYNQLQFIDKGSKLVRKLVREVFPDVHLLASSSCMGKGESSAGLDRHKVEVIKGFCSARCPSFSERDVKAEITKLCKEARYAVKKQGHFNTRVICPLSELLAVRIACCMRKN